MAEINSVLFCSFDYRPNIGGVATYSFEVASEMHRLGKKVTVVTSENKLPPPDNLPILIYKLPKSGLLSVPKYTYHLIKILKDRPIDTIFCSLWMPDGISALLACLILRRSDIKIFSAAHGTELIETKTDFKKKIRYYLSFVKIWFFRKCSLVFPISNYTKNLLLDFGIDENKIVVIKNGVNLKKFFKKTPSENISSRFKTSSKITFFTLARHVPHKGIDKVIKALSLLDKNKNNWLYLIAGTGPGTEYLKQMITKADHLKDKVHFLGHIAESDLIDYYNLCDVFILMSREEKKIPSVEGFGLVFLEAAACGKPSLGGNSGGIPEAIIEGETGWLADPNNSTAISQKITEILDHPAKIEIMGLNAFRRVQSDLNWQNVTKKIVQSMENIK